MTQKITINGRTITQTGRQVSVTPGFLCFNGVYNKEDVWTELTEHEATIRFSYVVAKVNDSLAIQLK